MSISSRSKAKHFEIFVLAFVVNLVTEPRVALFPDPWRYRSKGHLALETYHEFEGSFGMDTPVTYVDRAGGEEAESSAGEAFRYQPLKHGEIRLLEFSSNAEGTSIKGSIKHVQLDHPGRYCALSYCWGRWNQEGFYVETPKGKIQITRNLHSALRVLREKGVAPALWVDALCINQKDGKEKVLQVKQMDVIFQKAERVVAWLGEEGQRSHETLDELRKIRLRSLTSRSGTGYDVLPRSVEIRNFMADVNKFVARPWFRRVWIVQELVLPARVSIMCGHRSEMDWEEFFEALKICEMAYTAANSRGPDHVMILPKAGAAYALGVTRNKLKGKDQAKYSLLELLEMFSYAEVTEERDKLFAFLGLAHDARHPKPAFGADYDSKLEVVVRNYAKVFVDRRRGMELLYRAGEGKSYFSSWIPRLTERDFPKTISTWNATTPFRAGVRNPIEMAAPGRSPKKLLVGGYVVDSIRSVSTIRRGTGDTLDFFQTMTEFHRLLDSCVGERDPAGETIKDLLFKLPIGDARCPHLEALVDQQRSYRDFASPENDAWPANLRQLIHSVRLGQDPESWGRALSIEDQVTIDKYLMTAAALSNRLTGAVFCATDQGYVGLVPRAARDGDRICLLHSGKVPFVLRQLENAGRTWKLVGECYVHGIMGGEALKKSGLQPDVFTIE